MCETLWHGDPVFLFPRASVSLDSSWFVLTPKASAPINRHSCTLREYPKYPNPQRASTNPWLLLFTLNTINDTEQLPTAMSVWLSVDEFI